MVEHQTPSRKDAESNPAWVPSCVLEQDTFTPLTHLSLASLLWDIGKQYSPRCDAAERGVPSGAILFAYRNFIEKWIKSLKAHLWPLKMKVDSSK